MIRVAFFGPMCVGKTWCANILANELDFEKLSFATAVKGTAKKLFGVTTKSAESRRVLQIVGEKMREIDPNVWINQVVNTVNDHPNVDYVVDDLRYVNEAEALRALGFTLILVTENALVEMLYLIRRRFYNLPPEDEEELENDFDEYETQFSDESETTNSSTSGLGTFTWTYTEI
jgi:Holliday junction resolvasome RuvABC ATP-dependent DNA helicase subunit